MNNLAYSHDKELDMHHSLTQNARSFERMLRENGFSRTKLVELDTFGDYPADSPSRI